MSDKNGPLGRPDLKPCPRQCTVWPNEKHPEMVMNSLKSCMSIMYTASVSGTLLPTYVVYKAKNLYDSWTTNGPTGLRYNRTLSGWLDHICFHDWLVQIALPYFKKLHRKKILIDENLSHLSCAVVRLCDKADIHFVFLPSNMTHLIQPLDISFFKPLKTAWREILTKWKMGAGHKESCGLKSTFPTLLKELSNKIGGNSPENIRSGFRKAEIILLNRDEVLKCIPTSTTIDENTGEIIESSFEKFLRKLLLPSTCTEESTASVSTTKPRGRKKKIWVEPGKSVKASDFGPED